MKQFRILFAVVVMMMSSVAMAQTTVKGLLMDETLGESEPFEAKIGRASCRERV